jgi:hypothetical protein
MKEISQNLASAGCTNVVRHISVKIKTAVGTYYIKAEVYFCCLRGSI